MANIIVIYHGGCRDGFGGAWAARKKFGNKAEYIPAFNRFAPPREFKEKEIYLIDYTYNPDVVKRLIRNNIRVTAIDHHITAEKAVKMTRHYSFSLYNSGAVLAWKYFHPGKKIPTMLRIVEDSDLWKWEIRHAKEILAFIDLLKMDFASWNRIAKELESSKKRKWYAEKGKLVLRHEKYLLDEILPGAELVKFEGRIGYAVNAPHHFVSDLGEVLAKRGRSFAVIWREQAGEIRISLRSDGSVDVAKIAQKYNGGGHKRAAAFSFPVGKKFPWRIIKR
ncbi:MAG: DHHA1 domain-containing protein [Candidatus Liptonbacteria bacterium]|nr:DHHA1 domain-containing protein [Candidatus Liptonbacteria bacterium]